MADVAVVGAGPVGLALAALLIRQGLTVVVLDRGRHGVVKPRATHLDDESVDRVFISNFFEHVPREVILSTLIEARRVLRPDGKLLVLQPNVRYCGRDYWMFFDHITEMREMIMAETTESREEALEKLLPFQRDDFAMGLAVGNNELLLTGRFGGKVDFDTGTGIKKLSARGQYDAFLTGMNNGGTPLF